MNDITILSMLYESTAIVSVNGVLHLYQVTYLQNISLLKLLQEFAIHTSVALVIKWFITGVSLVIETHYQNMAVIAVLRRKWKRPVLIAMTNLVPLAFSTTPHLLDIVHGRSDESKGHSAKCASLRDLHLEIRWLATIKSSEVFPLQI